MIKDTQANALNHKRIRELDYQTPYFLFNKGQLLKNLAEYRRCLPDKTEVCYAMKANSQQEVIDTLAEEGVSFEVASTYELLMLKAQKVHPRRIIYGTAVKPKEMIKEFYDYGVKRYAFDSTQELKKIAGSAPGSHVYLRVLVNDLANSVFTMSEKFGTPIENASRLINQANDLGLKPYGISFNVGSQARNVEAWANALRQISTLMKELRELNTKIDTINLGGGFPYNYQPDDKIPTIQTIGYSIKTAAAGLPYGVKFMAEPGRGLVANTYTLITSVFERNNRPNGSWIYLDAGAYNALLEVMAYQGSIRYRVNMLRDSEATEQPFILTGPTGDSLDVIDKAAMLPSDIAVGDKLVVHDTGAYSLSLTTPFNGFPAPPTYQF